MDTLYPALKNRLEKTELPEGEYRGVTGISGVYRVVEIDQSPIGRTPRSNPATYVDLFGMIRRLFALVPEARARGYSPSRFSFNIRGGRCEACQGAGLIRVEMHFLPDLYVPCDLCQGKRYSRETLEIRYKGKNIYEVLELTVDEALEFFSSIPPLREKLELLRDVGLGYMRLGQPATTLSGGEAQRIKLSRELSRRSKKGTVYILDEPTTGLHLEDVRRLLELLHRLVDQGNTVIVIEHHLDVIRSADWVIDLGPYGGERGGEIVATGTPEEVAKTPASLTGSYLREVLFKRSAQHPPRALSTG
jgi:excinuclease ABC subunit A